MAGLNLFAQRKITKLEHASQRVNGWEFVASCGRRNRKALDHGRYGTKTLAVIEKSSVVRDGSGAEATFLRPVCDPKQTPGSLAGLVSVQDPLDIDDYVERELLLEPNPLPDQGWLNEASPDPEIPILLFPHRWPVAVGSPGVVVPFS
ncbi:hypothetical protein RRG08_046174 [Elysia crispata]|uniref:Uncharacterized protein n=1 Tax=Elysia crispata TaxID=231223 RepID=A0AAE0XNA2_9GAST|nr:hypothetical protein RRG08_046174 [Elysia crispata]